MKKERAAASRVKIPTIEALGQGKNDGVRMTTPAESQDFKVWPAQGAVESKIYPKYLFRDTQQAIKDKKCCKILLFLTIGLRSNKQ